MKFTGKKGLMILVITIMIIFSIMQFSYAEELYDSVDDVKSYYISDNGMLYPVVNKETNNLRTSFLLGAKSAFFGENSQLVSKYSLRDNIKINVYDQGNTERCWIYGTNSVLETTLKNESDIEKTFDVEKMESTAANIFNKEKDEGGSPLIALATYTGGNGPITTENNKIDTKIENYEIISTIYKDRDAYGNITYNNNGFIYSDSQMKTIRNTIKNHIIEHGAVTASMYSGKNKEFFNMCSDGKTYCYYNYYNSSNSKYQPNHQVTIIGWDDNYSKDNFASTNKPKNNGAYIVLNSWGKDFSDNGIFYVSYEDAFIESCVYGVSDITEVKYDNLYQYDPTGNSNSISLVGNYEYGANVFTRNNKKPELLTEISIANLYDTAYEVYINPNSENLNFENLTKVATTKKLCAGFHTIKFDKEIVLSGEKFAVVVKYKNNNTANEGQYFGVEYTFKQEYLESGLISPFETATIKEGESYLYNGTSNEWIDICRIKSNTQSTVLKQMCNLCIKAYTEEYVDKIQPTITKVSKSTTEWTKDSVTVSIEGASDNCSSINELQYSFDGGTTWQYASKKVYTINTSNIEICVKDTNNNIYKHNEKIVINNIDKTNPTLKVEEEKNEESIFSQINIECSDAESGIKTLTINNIDYTSKMNNNKLTYKVSQNGKYEITVIDEAGNKISKTIEINSVIFKIESEKYTICETGFITGIDEKTSIKEVTSNIKTSSGKIEINDETIKTGSKLKVIENGIEIVSYTLVVTGDCTGDGKVDSVDLLSALRQYKYDQLNGKSGKKLSGENLIAIKFSNSEKYSAVDLLGELRLYKNKK